MNPAAATTKPFPPGMPVAEGDVIAGKYRVEGLVAVGGMGVVVLARHLSLGQQVAIKVLLPSEVGDDSTAAVPRFLREARAAAGLKSEHVVRIFDVDTLPSGLPYMVMEHLTGQDLRRVVKLGGPIAVEQAVDYVLQAADAIGEAHVSGIVHRDLKPSNLFLTHHTDGRPWVKVLDFGISKASQDPTSDTALTVSRAMIGSPMYMSPEQVRDAKSVDGRSDIWSLGVILHELLTGKSAFRGESLPAICAAIAADQPESLTALRPDVPPTLVAIVRRCLEKNPAQRFQSVDELRQALQPFLGHFAPTMPVPPPSARSGAAAAASGPISTRLPLGSSGSIDVAVGLVSSGASSAPTSIRIDGNFDRASDPDAPTLHRDLVPASQAASDAPFSATGVTPRRGGRLPLVLTALVLVFAVVLAFGVNALLAARKNSAVAGPAASTALRGAPSAPESAPAPTEPTPSASVAAPLPNAEPALSASAARPADKDKPKPRAPETKATGKRPEPTPKPGEIRLSR